MYSFSYHFLTKLIYFACFIFKVLFSILSILVISVIWLWCKISILRYGICKFVVKYRTLFLTIFSQNLCQFEIKFVYCFYLWIWKRKIKKHQSETKGGPEIKISFNRSLWYCTLILERKSIAKSALIHIQYLNKAR